jgi:DNA-binding response OmpR family regulator/anti-sigma regulatory factor (Ser/Thr protein kinase)
MEKTDSFSSSNKDTMKKPLIIVIDDEPGISECIERTLSDFAKVAVARSGISGLSSVKIQKPDLILLDTRMPDIDGYEVCRLLRENEETKDIPVIFVTAHGQISDIIRGYEAGGIDCVTKPFSQDQLRERIAEVLEKNGLERENDRLNRLNTLLYERISRLEKTIEKAKQGQHFASADNETINRYKAICHATAHNLKGEFFHIGNSVEEIRERTVKMPDIAEECDIIERSVEYGSHALQKLLDFIEIGVPRKASANIGELLLRIESIVKPRLPAGLELKVQAEQETLKQTIHTDVDQLTMIAIELINNAIDATWNSGGTIRIIVEKGIDRFKISVEDNGNGVPEKVKDDLFRKQVPSGKGTGLGLYLGKKVLEVLGGDLYMEFSSAEGSRFTIDLPATDNERKER